MSIILDCDLMRFPNSGLFHYCLNIGANVNALLKKQGEAPMELYVPKGIADTFGRGFRCIEEKKWHRLFKPFLYDCWVWHAPFQSGRVIPDRKRHSWVKVLLTIHDLNQLHEGKSSEEQKHSLRQTQDLIDRSDAIVCISDFTRSDVLRNCDVGSKPVYVIHNGTHKVHEPALLSTSSRPRRPFLFGMGYINRKKNYHVLLSLLEKNADLDLVVAGRLDEPDYVGHIKTTAEEMGVADRLYLTGPVSENEKAWYLHNCLAFVHPSIAEGFGAPVVEAMIFGKPLFLSDKTSLPEIGGSTAFYFRSFDPESMSEVFKQGMANYKNKNLEPLIKERGKRFDWEKSAEKYLEVYKSLY